MYACCDWAAVYLGHAAARDTSARRCASHPAPFAETEDWVRFRFVDRAAADAFGDQLGSAPSRLYKEVELEDQDDGSCHVVGYWHTPHEYPLI